MEGYLDKEKMMSYLMTILLIAANVVIFLGLSFIGMTEDSAFLLEHGASYLPYILYKGEYYRIFTSMFLHFGFDHLMSNMMMLALMGYRLEPAVGKIRFLIIYLSAGLMGNLISLFQEYMSGECYVSAGASGAVFGLIGSMLFVAFMNKTGRYLKKYGYMDLNTRDMCIIIGLGIYSGFTSAGIDNAAHLGGLIAGFLFTALVTIGQFRKKSDSF
ncbi:MAG: rhomboid family intramembrane serine protease [Dorea sp.]|nr:rhomboid family intramembrane serine protease [Dorea sp.]